MTDFYCAINLEWSSGEQDATEQDAEEALKRSGLTHGTLLGEWLITHIERVEEA